MLRYLNVSAVPSAPTGPLEVVAAGSHAVVIEWGAPESDGGAPLEGYDIALRDARRTMWMQVGTVVANQQRLIIKDLQVSSDQIIFFFFFFLRKRVRPFYYAVFVCFFFFFFFFLFFFLFLTDFTAHGECVQRHLLSLHVTQDVTSGSERIIAYCLIPSLFTFLSCFVEQEGRSYLFRVFARNEIGLSDALESEEPLSISRPSGRYNVNQFCRFHRFIVLLFVHVGFVSSTQCSSYTFTMELHWSASTHVIRKILRSSAVPV